MPGLRADYAWHARCLPAFHAKHRRRAGLAHPHPMKQDCSSGCAWAMGGPPMAQAWPRPGLGHSHARCLDERENHGGKYSWKFLIDVHGRKREDDFLQKNQP